MVPSFTRNTVTGKTFDTNQSDGRDLWEQLQLARDLSMAVSSVVAERRVTRGEPVLIIPRRGQGAFRALVTNAYARRCAITGETTLPVLEAAHIRPVSADGFHSTSNGLLLRSDFHKLFDHGLVTITPEHTVIVSERIKAQWLNGKAYSRLHGGKLAVLPVAAADHPRAEFLQWHNEHVFERTP